MAPPCLHYLRDDCGGCQLQHLSSPAQRAARRAIVGDALRRLGHLDLPDPLLEPSPADWGYRTRLTLAVGPDGAVGLHRLGKPDAVFPLERCEIAAPAINQLWAAVRSVIAELCPGLDQVVLKEDRTGGLHLLLRGPARPPRKTAERLAASVPGVAPVTLWWQAGHAPARHIGGVDSSAPATAFEQVHPAMGDRVRAYAINLLGSVAGLRVWDLYAGLGDASMELARLGAAVDSVEIDPAAVAHADRTFPAASVARHAGRVEGWVRRLPAPGAVLANPPRTGMTGAVTDALREVGPNRIVYVSCDPATLARDLARLGGGFRSSSVTAFDLFPQTAHVETVALLERQSSA